MTLYQNDLIKTLKVIVNASAVYVKIPLVIIQRKQKQVYK